MELLKDLDRNTLALLCLLSGTALKYLFDFLLSNYQKRSEKEEKLSESTSDSIVSIEKVIEVIKVELISIKTIIQEIKINLKEVEQTANKVNKLERDVDFAHQKLREKGI